MLLLGIFLVFAVQYAVAVEPGGATVSASNLGTDTDGPSPENISIQSGYLYNVSLTTSAQTFRWVGIAGNVTGTIYLNDSSENSFYSWAGAEGKYVYISRDNNVDWTNLQAASNSDMPSFLTVGTSGDRWNATFGATKTFISGYLGSIASVPYTTLNSTWECFSMMDGGGADTDNVWAANVTSGIGFNGNAYEYEILIPEDGSGGDSTNTTYYFYAELL